MQKGQRVRIIRGALKGVCSTIEDRTGTIVDGVFRYQVCGLWFWDYELEAV